MLKATLALTRARLVLFTRDPQLVFWTLLFPVVMLVLFGEIFIRKAPPGVFNGANYIDGLVPGLIGISIGSVAIFTIGIETAEAREKGILRRFKVTPLPSLALFASTLMTASVLVFFQCAELIAVGRFRYDLHISVNPIVATGAMIFAALSGLALGYVLASVAPSGRAANAIGMVLMMPQIGLSGALFPLSTMSDSLQTVSKFLPLTYINGFLQDAFAGHAFRDLSTNLLVLLAFLVSGLIVSIKAFRWETT